MVIWDYYTVIQIQITNKYLPNLKIMFALESGNKG